MVTPGSVVVFWLVSGSATSLSRLTLREGLKYIRRKGRNLRNLVIVGTNSRAVEFARQFESRPELGCRIIGFVDAEWRRSEEFQKAGYRVACDFETFPSFLRSNVVDELVMALPVRSFYTQASRIAVLCEEQGVTVRLLSRIFDQKRTTARSDEPDQDLITHYMGTGEGGWLVVKRILDFSISLTLIVLLAPLFLVTALLIKLTSEGPVFFAQKRLGLNKRRFSMYKFRTMVADAEQKLQEIEHLNEVSGPVFKIKNDPRITRTGKWLRRTSIDELPQLFNVLKGDMSLVGPRPLPVRDYEGFNQDWQRRRFSVRPGITCLWQVAGRSSVQFDEWMKLDVRYVDHWSLWLDLQILLRTIPAVLRGSGAV